MTDLVRDAVERGEENRLARIRANKVHAIIGKLCGWYARDKYGSNYVIENGRVYWASVHEDVGAAVLNVDEISDFIAEYEDGFLSEEEYAEWIEEYGEGR